MNVQLYVGDDDPIPWIVDCPPPNVGETVWLKDMTKFPSSTKKYVVVRRVLSVMRIRDRNVPSYEITLELAP